MVKKSKERKLRIKLVKSVIGYPQKQREIVRGLGLRRLHHEVIRPDTPAIRGMVEKVKHLVEMEEL